MVILVADAIKTCYRRAMIRLTLFLILFASAALADPSIQVAFSPS
jgi:hypothetical protein